LNATPVHERLRTSLLLLALLLAAWLPRALGLERFVTVDERKWLARAANFYQAIAHADWAHTFQREHPGVTVMWAGALAFVQRYPTYAAESPGQFTWEQEHWEAWLAEHSTLTPLQMLAAARRWMAFLISLALVLGFFPLRHLLGAPLAALATLLVVWNPFTLALSQQLHPDGFVSALTYLALVLWLAWLYGARRTDYLMSAGLVMGLAWLTKTPAILLAPTGALLLLFELRRQPSWRARGWLAGAFALWGLVATLTFVALWPAMWIDPLGVLVRMASEMEEYVERHTTINYFWGQAVDDPGPLFYPVAFLWRTTPLVLIGLVSAGVSFWRRRWPLAEQPVRQCAAALLLFALILTAGMTLGAKKFDRYLLPAFPALDILATLGLLALPTPLTRRFTPSPLHPVTLPITFATILLFHALLGFLHFPYYLTYYNPLVGGSWTASRVLFTGWGEGLDEAARWLNQQPKVDELRVVSWYADGPFSYLFHGRYVGASYDTSLFWIDTDYAVFYVNQWQRNLPSPEIVHYFLAQQPVYTVHTNGLTLAHVYDLRNMAVPPFVNLHKEGAADFGGQIRLSAHKLEPAQANPGEPLQLTLYLQSLAPMTINYNILVRLLAQDGSELWRDEGWPWGAPTAGWPLRQLRPDGHTITLPMDAKAGLYKLTVGFYDPTNFAPLPVTAVKSDQMLHPSAQEIRLLQVGPLEGMEQTAEPIWRFEPFFAMNGVNLPAEVAPGAQLPVRIQWESRQATTTAYTVFVHVVDQAGDTVAQQDRPPLHGFAPTNLWTPGLQLMDDFIIPLPADLPTGQYRVRVGLYTAAGRLLVWHGSEAVGDFATIGSLNVVARPSTP
jgi:hypothetical protein